MSSPRDAGVYLADILDAAEDARRFVEGLSKEAFLRDRKSVFAVVRAIEVMGEATKRVPRSVRERAPDIPWQRVAGMRDVLIHDYFRVDLEVVWVTVTRDVPRIAEQIQELLEDLDRASDAG